MPLIAALLLSLTPLGQDTPGEPAKRIDDLIKQLGADEFSVREKATEELKRIGRPAREALEKAAEKNGDPEVRERARAALDQMAEKPRAEAPRRAAPGMPGLRGLGGSSVTVQSINGDTTYRITPGDGSPAITFHKDKAGAVKVDYTDEKGESKSAEAGSIEKFLKDQPELAGRFGITEDGIEYGGTRVSFKGGLPGFAFPRGPNRGRFILPPAFDGEEGFRAEGATFEKVSEALRAQLELPEGQGLVVTKVEEGGAAHSAGLRKSDILLEIDGTKVASVRELRETLRGAKSALVLRKGRRETLTPSTPKKNF
jgi:hypothetical protein